jgi:hypothetical protein
MQAVAAGREQQLRYGEPRLFVAKQIIFNRRYSFRSDQLRASPKLKIRPLFPHLRPERAPSQSLPRHPRHEDLAVKEMSTNPAKIAAVQRDLGLFDHQLANLLCSYLYNIKCSLALHQDYVSSHSGRESAGH